MINNIIDDEDEDEEEEDNNDDGGEDGLDEKQLRPQLEKMGWMKNNWGLNWNQIDGISPCASRIQLIATINDDHDHCDDDYAHHVDVNDSDNANNEMMMWKVLFQHQLMSILPEPHVEDSLIGSQANIWTLVASVPWGRGCGLGCPNICLCWIKFYAL